MPEPRLASSSKKPRKVINPAKKPKKIIEAEPKIEILDPVEEDLGLQEILVDDAYRSVLADVRNDLNQSEKILSRFVHAKGMDKFHDFLVKTIARPNSLLGGSMFALIGVLVGVTLAKTNGYSYNYLSFIFLFILGYGVELLLEILINLFRLLKK